MLPNRGKLFSIKSSPDLTIKYSERCCILKNPLFVLYDKNKLMEASRNRHIE